MTDLHAYDALLPELREMDASMVRSPDMPVDVAIHEGEVHCALFAEDQETFAKVGSGAEVGEKLSQAVGALRISDANLKVSMKEQSAAVEEFRVNEGLCIRIAR